MFIDNEIIISLINSDTMIQYLKKSELNDITKAYIICNSEKICIQKKISLLKCLESDNETILRIIDNYDEIIIMFANDDKAIYRLSVVDDEDHYRYYTEYGIYNTLHEVKEVVDKIKDATYFMIIKEYMNTNQKIIMFINSSFDYIKVDTKNILSNHLLKTSTTHPFRVGDVIYQRLSFDNDTLLPMVVSKIDMQCVEVIYIDVSESDVTLRNITISNLLDYELQKDMSNESDIFICLVSYQRGERNLESLLMECNKYQREMRN